MNPTSSPLAFAATVHVPSWAGIARAMFPYAAACLAVILATVIRAWLDPYFGERSPFITYIGATVAVAWRWGAGPGLTVILLGFPAACYYFAHPRGSVQVWGFGPQVGALWYILTGVLVVILTSMTRSSERRATGAARELREQERALQAEVRERRAAQAAYTELLRRIVSVQEDERRRISQELHDQCGQDVTAIQLELRLLRDAITAGTPTAPRCESLQRLITRVADEIHHLALKLRPPELDDHGLTPAVEDFVTNWSRLTGVPVDLACSGSADARVDNNIETALYRVLQESMTNIARHARATSVSVVLSRGPSACDLIVEDQGCGFCVPDGLNATSPRHLGLLGMRERMASVGGRLEIESTVGKGTTVFARAPYSYEISDGDPADLPR